MLRTLVLFLLIAIPLWSQDLLVDSIEREFSGTLIKITDSYIYFQIQGATEPVQYPFWSVQRVTLADGRLAFEDGNIYVAKPTLTAEPKLAEPTPSVAKPVAPQPMEAGPEVELPTQLPAPVPEPAEKEAVATGTPPVFTRVTLMTMARDNAVTNFGTPGWDVGGGLLGCGGLLLGSIIGTVMGGLPGFFVGAGFGGALVAHGLANRVNIIVPIPEELEFADTQLQEQYRQLFLAETRRLKRKSIYTGIGGCCLVWIGLSMLPVVIRTL